MLVFQYGSNMSSARLNDSRRLNGAASIVGVVSTVETFDFGFTVHSTGNNCAAADIVASPNGRTIFGVLYDIPDELVTRQSAKSVGRKSLDAIEGEGGNYKRITIDVRDSDHNRISASTYVVRIRHSNLITSLEYAQHIVDGLKEHVFPKEYCEYVIEQIERCNPQLKGLLTV
ncbi:gamma-glutamylcyclotransferase [Bremerella cremea]|uniref:gamma-glutamylcyclotransferase n=1 Tax=Bremerella cremea TaxID=1031537 RepID=UPI00338179DB